MEEIAIEMLNSSKTEMPKKNSQFSEELIKDIKSAKKVNKLVRKKVTKYVIPM